jgi:hypothetical protein
MFNTIILKELKLLSNKKRNKNEQERLRCIINTEIQNELEIPEIVLQDPNNVSGKTIESEFIPDYERIIKDIEISKVLNNIHQVKIDGGGKGELLLAYLCRDILVRGNLSSVDFQIGNYDIELKAPHKCSSRGWVRDFRLGNPYSKAMNIFIKGVSSLVTATYNTNKKHKPEFRITKEELEDAVRGAIMPKVINKIVGVDSNDIKSSELVLNRREDGCFEIKGFGKVLDPSNSLKELNEYIDQMGHIKDYYDLEQTFMDSIKEIKLPYLWLTKSKNGAPMMITTDSVTGYGCKVSCITQNLVKITTMIYG